jgi:acetyl-CoA acetyltransferase
MEAYIIDGVRTPIGSYQGALAAVRADDLAAIVIKAIVEKNPNIEYRPLFFINTYKNGIRLETVEKYDFVFIGTGHGEREEILKRIVNRNKNDTIFIIKIS